jgi:hypothetical protein
MGVQMTQAGSTATWQAVFGDECYVQLWRYSENGEQIDLPFGMSWTIQRVGDRRLYVAGETFDALESHGLLIERADGVLLYAERFMFPAQPGELVTLSEPELFFS